MPGLAFFEPEELDFLNIIDASANQEDLSNSMDLRKLLEARREYNLATGKLEKVYIFGKSAFGLLFALENGAHWFTAMNFGSDGINYSGKLPIFPVEVLFTADHAQKQKFSFTGASYQLDLAGWECLNIVLRAGHNQKHG